VNHFLKRIGRLICKVRYFGKANGYKLFRPEVAGGACDDLHRWPLFERMRLATQGDSDRQHSREIFSGIQSQPSNPPRIISPEEFSADRLLAEIAALPASGGEVHLPAGRVELFSELRIASGVRLIGVPGRTELVFRDTHFGIVLSGIGDTINGAWIKNIKIRHEGDHRFCAAIFVAGATDVLLSHVEIIAPRAVGFLLADGVSRARLEHCAVSHAGLVGFMMIRNVRDTILQSCVAEYCGQSGVFLTDLKLAQGMDPLDFDGQIHYTNQVVGNFGPFAPEDPSPYRNSFIDCVFRCNRKMGITTDGVGYLRVVNCVIAENDCEGITIDNGSWGCHVQNCHIYNNGWRGLQHHVELHTDLVGALGFMEDGSSKSKLPGVSLDNAAYTRIEDNCIEGNWGDGVKFVRSVYGCTVARNHIANNNRGMNDRFHFFGVLVGVAKRQHPDQYDFPSCHNRIVENDIIGKHHAGIHLMHTTTGNLVQNNMIVDASFAPIEDHDTIGNNVRYNGPDSTGYEAGDVSRCKRLRVMMPVFLHIPIAACMGFFL
jgi:parallel beta-helix repeat protein